jgi:hypothetical protein
MDDMHRFPGSPREALLEVSRDQEYLCMARASKRKCIWISSRFRIRVQNWHTNEKATDSTMRRHVGVNMLRPAWALRRSPYRDGWMLLVIARVAIWP